MDPALAREVAILAQSKVINEAIARGDSEIQQFYKDATVFITGGTGFMGKQMIEKLFRSCDIKKVFLLMRHKRKKSFHERLEHMLEDPVFDQVKKMKPGFEKRICPVQGDVSEVGLGISPEELAAIVEETEIIFHGAAIVNFDEPLKEAVNTNVRGTVEMLNLGKQCKKLKSYVHVSTAFAHCTKSRIDQDVCEQFYDSPLSPQLAIEMVASMEETRLNDITPQLLQNWPNTYTFTKAIAEEACRLAASELPISIVRPAIVICSHLEPSPGWLDTSCAYGPSGFVLGCGLGVLHVILKKNFKTDLVPVDLVNNAIIAVGCLSAKRRGDGESEAKIYTVTNNRNHVYWDDLSRTYINDVAPNYASPKSLYLTFVYQTKFRLMYLFLIWLWHYIPAYILDVGLSVMGKQPVGVRVYTRADKHTKALSYFMTHEWLNQDKNLQELYDSLNPTDKQIYNFDISSINWSDLLLIWQLGVRKYIIKDELQGTDYGNKKQYWFKILHYTVFAPLYFFLLIKLAIFAFSLLFYGISLVINFFQ